MIKMNKKILAASLLSCLLTTSPVFAEKMPEAGLNDKVEWTLAQSWTAPTGVLDLVHSLDGKLVFFLTDDQKIKIYTNKGVYQGAVSTPKGVTNIDIAPQGETLYLVNNTTNEFTALTIDLVVNVDTSGSPQKGADNAPVSIVVFTDFECPYCSKLSPILEQVYSANPKNVQITFKNLPLKFHKYAKKAALAGLAADKQGKFWEFHDKIFAIDNLDKDDAIKVAKDLDLDMDKFKNDMESTAVQEQLAKDMNEAVKAGVTGTPTVFINGRKLKQRNTQSFQIMIDAELKKAGLK
ncbi:MAG: thioredoxin domain-containing protein [Desulfotalea sp.]